MYTTFEIKTKLKGIDETETRYADESLVLQLAELNDITN